MARFEGALARASAPAEHADIISRVCERAQFDALALAREGRTGTLAIPFVKQLTAQVAAVSPEAARHVHAGATSQDVIDTAAVLCLGPACARVAELTRQLGDATAALAQRHARTPTRLRATIESQTAAFQPKVTARAGCSSVRATVGVRACRCASAAVASPSWRVSSATLAHAGPRHKTAAVSMTS